MAHGTQSNDFLKTTYFKVAGLRKGETDLYFAGREKVGDKYVDIEERPTFIEGTLKELKVTDYTYEGKVHKVVKITLEDMNERCVLDFGFSSIGLNIINSLAGADSIGNVNLALYTSKTGYPSVAVKLNGSSDVKETKWKWDFKKDFAPKIEKITNKKGEVIQSDKTELVEFLVDYLNSKEFQDKIVGQLPTESKKMKPQVKVPVDVVNIEDDDLPF